MYHVYVLQGKNKRLYKGLTNNLDRRVQEHLRGKTKTTRYMNEIKLVHREKYSTFKEARKRELYLKSAAGRRFLKKILFPSD